MRHFSSRRFMLGVIVSLTEREEFLNEGGARRCW
jgi:hypothetical protein